MKRSEINAAIRYAMGALDAIQFKLPVWCHWTPEDWAGKGKECEEIVRNGMGWDVTSFGSSDFEKIGLTAITIRNGNPQFDDKPYCEKIMIVRENQVTPIHFHWNKMEDIIVRGGANLCIQLWNSNKAEEKLDGPVKIKIDGVVTEIPSGEVFKLKPGQSICFTPYIYHTFWGDGGTCLAGEVSKVNDDNNDNRFFEPLPRYVDIEEDEPAIRYLCNEYPVLK